MGLTPKDVQALLDAFEASSWQEMTVEVGDDRIHVSRRTSAASTVSQASGSPSADVRPYGDGRSPSDPDVPAASQTTTPRHRTTAMTGTPVTAPSVGVFWRSPSPGAPPFVDVGSRVAPDDTVGILEIMKLMKPIPAGTDGTVSAILVDNGAAVEYGQSLVLVQPDA